MIFNEYGLGWHLFFQNFEFLSGHPSSGSIGYKNNARKIFLKNKMFSRSLNGVKVSIFQQKMAFFNVIRLNVLIIKFAIFSY